MVIQIDIPNTALLCLNHLVLDYNGTIARDGDLIDGAAAALELLSGKITIHVLTADTHGSAKTKLHNISCKVEIIDGGKQDESKLAYVERLGFEGVVAIGNGRNDKLMLKRAELGIAVIQKEGCSSHAVESSDIVCLDIIDALNLLLKPARLAATLRN